MRLTVLGSGTMTAGGGRFPSSYLLEEGGTRMLLDCGFLVMMRLLERNMDFQSIDAILLTHFHTDHIGHLLPLLHARHVQAMFTHSSPRPITVFGPLTLRERYAKLREVMWPEPKEEYPLTIVEGDTHERVGPFHVRSFPTQHVPWFPSQGYRIEAVGKSLVYTGDIGELQEQKPIEEAVQGADFLLIEAGASKPSKSHATAAYAFDIAKRHGVKRVLLTHIAEHRLRDVRAFAEAHRDILSIADDGMVITV